MLLPSILNQRNLAQNNIFINELLEINKNSEGYGLMLTLKDVREIIESRDAALLSHGRVELEIDTTKKLIQRLYGSPFICQEEYVSVIIGLQELFYYIKNETEDKLSDDELMDKIFYFYNDMCEGSIDLLREMLEVYAKDIRYQNQKKDNLMGVDGQWNQQINF